MRAAALPIVLLCAAAAGAQSLEPSEAVFVEVVPERETWYVGEWARVDVRLGYDAEFLDRSVVQAFQRELDVPVRIVAPWAPDGALWLFGTPRDAPEVAWNERTVALRPSGDEDRDGRTFAVLTRRVAFPLSEASEVPLETALELTVATEFREDFVEGRVALDPRPVRLTGPTRRLRVVELPIEGRPEGFSGAVGHVTVDARIDDVDAASPAVVPLTFSVSIAGPAPPFELPALDGLAGFRLVGSRDGYPFAGAGNTGAGPGAAQRVARHYELELVDAAVRAIPAIPFTYFDPVSGAYRTVHTEPLQLPAGVAAVEPASEERGSSAPRDDVPAGLIGVLALAVLLLVAGAIVVRRRNGRGRDPSPATHAADEARTALDDPTADPADVLAGYLAQRLGCAPPAVVSTDLTRRLVAAGVAPDVAERTASLLERLVAARYGGAATTDTDRDDVRQIIARF